MVLVHFGVQLEAPARHLTVVFFTGKGGHDRQQSALKQTTAVLLCQGGQTAPSLLSSRRAPWSAGPGSYA